MEAVHPPPPVKKPTTIASPPRRGKIKARIFGGIAEAVASAASRARDFLFQERWCVPLFRLSNTCRLFTAVLRWRMMVEMKGVLFILKLLRNILSFTKGDLIYVCYIKVCVCVYMVWYVLSLQILEKRFDVICGLIVLYFTVLLVVISLFYMWCFLALLVVHCLCVL